MGEHAGKCNQRYLDCTRDISKQTCLVHGPRNYSLKCKLLNNYSIKYAAGTLFKEFRKEPTYAKKCTKNK